MDSLLGLVNDDTLIKLFGPLSVLIVVVAVRILLVRALPARVSAPELRRRWMVGIHNVLFILLSLALISIWAQTIQTVFVSSIAVAVALVIAAKELLMCLLGSLVRIAGDSYATGDRVEIGTHRGDVIGHNPLTTMLLELGSGTASQQHTGRTITMPNSVLLTTPVTKESSTTPYSVHLFVIPVGRDGNLDDYIRILLEAANAECAPFLEDVKRHWKRLATLHEVTESSPEPHVGLEMTFTDQVDLIVRIPSPIGGQAALQEAVLRRFLAAQRALEST